MIGNLFDETKVRMDEAKVQMDEAKVRMDEAKVRMIRLEGLWLDESDPKKKEDIRQILLGSQASHARSEEAYNARAADHSELAKKRDLEESGKRLHQAKFSDLSIISFCAC